MSNLYQEISALYRKMNREAENSFAATRLSPSHCMIIKLLQAKNNQTISEISESLGLTPSTVSRLVDKLALMKLLNRRNAGKAVKVDLNLKGKLLFVEIEQAEKKLNDWIRASLADEVKALAKKI